VCCRIHLFKLRHLNRYLFAPIHHTSTHPPLPWLPSCSGKSSHSEEALNRPASDLLSFRLTLPLHHLPQWTLFEVFDRHLPSSTGLDIGLEHPRQSGRVENLDGYHCESEVTAEREMSKTPGALGTRLFGEVQRMGGGEVLTVPPVGACCNG